MKVYQAESGASLNVRAFAANESLEQVKEEIFALSLIPPQAQILLLGGTAGGAQVKETNVEDIFKENAVLYVYNRLLLLDTPDSAAMMPVVPDIEPPVPLKVLADLNFRTSATTADKCAAYVNVFRSHMMYSQATSRTAAYHLSICEKSYLEQKAQADALAVALTNLKGHSRAVCEAFDNFYQHAQKEMAKHAVRIQSFPTDMQALHRLPIHAAIVDGDRYLSDYVPEDRLITWAENCRIAHENLAHKVATSAEAIKTVRAGNEYETSTSLDLDLRQLDSHLADVRSAHQRLDAKYQRVERDLAKIEEMLADAQSVQSEKFSSLDHLLKIHRDEYLPAITDNDAMIRRLTTILADSKKRVSAELLRRLRSISQLQSQIAAVSPVLTELSDTMNAHTQAFAQLLHVHRMPAAWGAALVEIVRRKEFVKVFISKAKEMADVLGRFRSQEERRRETFRSEIARYLPTNLVQGLDDKPPYCEVSLSNTTGSLPDLSREDVNEFEKLITSIHSTMLDNEPGGGAGASQTHSNHSISKLIATIVKMSSQVDATPADFERILAKSGFSEKLTRLEEENARLRMGGARSLADEQFRTLISRSPSSGQDAFGAQQEIASLRDRLLESDAIGQAAERRCLEMKAQLFGAEQQLQAERKKGAELNKALQFTKDEKQQLEVVLDRCRAGISDAERTQAALETEASRAHLFYEEVSAALAECSRTLEEPSKNAPSTPRASSPSAPATVTADDIRKSLRALHDDILCQTAELVSCRDMLRSEEDHTNTESIDMEVVALAAEVAELRADLQRSDHDVQELREQLTSTEAREAIVEAELHSVRALLKRAETDLAALRVKLIEQKKEAVSQQERSSSEFADIRTSLEGRISELEAEITRGRLALEADRVSLASLQDRIADLDAGQQELPDAAASTQELVNNICELWDAHQTIVRTSQLNSQREIEGLTTKVADLARALEAMKQAAAVSAAADAKIQAPEFPKSLADNRQQCGESTALSEIRALYHRSRLAELNKIAFRNFKTNDLALFLPTRNPKAWAAFNVNSPHYFLSPDSAKTFADRMK
ncbi:oligomeric, coiled-coil, peripheral membrane protein [Geranomyces variabilis]|nr:oligomeric, coiled-coil, peripheral membrane protein [Geranomyces variabilis]